MEDGPVKARGAEGGGFSGGEGWARANRWAHQVEPTESRGGSGGAEEGAAGRESARPAASPRRGLGYLVM